MENKIIFTNLVGTAIDDLVASLGNPNAIVITDVNTGQFVLPLLRNDSKTVAGAVTVTVPSGETAKSVEQLAKVWKELIGAGATRSSVIINVGGGVVSDLGGFAAATFKRGMRFINVPTTVLGAVDASFGGKTGINFEGLKNQIGVFADPEATIISSIYFNTLPQVQILSGYAEMIKHGLLDGGEVLGRLLAFSPVYPQFDSERLLPLIQESSQVKVRTVAEDPREGGLRKILNLGHTAGHALESLATRRTSPIPHGYAVAWGLVIALVLSNLELNFPSETLHKVASYVRTNYGGYGFTCDDYPYLLEAMSQDKKNASADAIAFTLLEDVGKPRINCVVPKDRIEAALDIYRDLME